MRRLAILLLVFIVSISVFAQGKSSFLENFSLVGYSGGYNRSFFNFGISSLDYNLFYTGNNGYWLQQQESQTLRFPRFSERTHLLGVNTLENRIQSWENMSNLMYGQKENVNSKKKSESLAEGYLKRLAERSKKIRKTWGAVGLIGGGICLGLGAAAMSSAEEEEDVVEGFFTYFTGIMLVATGVGGVVGGTLSFVIPSGAERELEDVLRISDLAQRERASHEALSSLADRGKKWRILSCILCAGLSAYSLLSKEGDYLSAGEFGAFAVHNLIRKTPAERAFQNYLRERELRKKLGLSIGVVPYGGVKIGLSLSF